MEPDVMPLLEPSYAGFMKQEWENNASLFLLTDFPEQSNAIAAS